MNLRMITFIRVLTIVTLCIIGIEGSTVRSQAENRKYTLATAWSNDGSKIAAVGLNPATDEGYIFIFDSSTGQLISRSDTPYGGYASAAWSPDDRYLAVGSFDQTIKIFDIEAGEIIESLPGHRGGIPSVDWNADGTLLVSSSPNDQQVILWDTTTYQPIRNIEIGDPWAVRFSPTGGQIGIASAAGLFLFSSQLEGLNRENPDENWIIRRYLGTLAWSHDGSKIGFGTQGFTNASNGETYHPEVFVIDSASRTVISSFTIEGGKAIYGMAWSPNDEELATYSIDGQVRVWDVKTSTLLDSFAGNVDFIESSLAFSPYGGRLVYGGSIASDSAVSSDQQADTAGAIHIVVPAPSVERLQAIAAACNAPDAIRASVQAAGLSSFVEQVEALPEGTIPSACAADLIAVAEALGSQ